MITKDAKGAINHLEQVVSLARELQHSGLAVYRHEYSSLLMGSFLLELGTKKCRTKFQWDGQEGFLDIQIKVFKNAGDTTAWTPAKNIRLSFTPEEPFKAIRAFRLTQYAA